MKKQFLSIFTSLICWSCLPIYAQELPANLKYDEIKESAQAKLNTSDLFIKTVNQDYQALNPVYGLKTHLTLKWSSEDKKQKLHEVILRSEDYEASDYATTVKTTWNQTIKSISEEKGEPLFADKYPVLDKINDQVVMYTHGWECEDGFLYVGIGKKDGKLQLYLCYSREKHGC